MEIKQPQTGFDPYTLRVIILAALVATNILFLVFTTNVVKTTTLLKKESTTLVQDQQTLASSEQLYDSYKDQIDLIAAVIPSEETIPTFIRALEDLTRATADVYTVKFVSLTPLVEQEKLYLLLTVTMKTDAGRFIQFLTDLEQLPYLIHITSIQAMTPEGYNGKEEVTLGLKLYVKNPFVAAK